MKHISIRVALFLSILLVGSTFPMAVSAGEYESTVDSFQYGDYLIPAYDGAPSENVNEGMPAFSEEELVKEPFVEYGELDPLGRCTVCYGDLNQSLMPTWKRGSISQVKPTGWVQKQYDSVSGKYLYNRCHLIGWQLTGADQTSLSLADLSKDLITGTRYLNVGEGGTGMLEFENFVADYLKESEDNYFLYRVTPVFLDEELVARGVLMEGESVDSPDMCYCAFCYNVQPGISIDYETGDSMLTSQVGEVVDINTCAASLSPKKFAYDGKEKAPAVTIKDGENALLEDINYVLAFNNNLHPGKAQVNIAGVGHYSGSMTIDFVIVPAKGTIKKAAAKRNGITITATKKHGADGYQFAYRKANKKSWKTAIRASNTFTIKSLKKNTRYKVKVRAYVKIDGNKHYGSWSTVKTCKTKK